MSQDIKLLYVYILRCADDSYYIGITNNISRREQEHNDGLTSTSYTYQRRPVKLVYQQAFEDYELAIRWEKRLKTWSKAKKEALINNDIARLKELASCKNHTSHKFFKKETDSD